MTWEIPLAYKFVLTTMMLLHANYFCETLDVPLDHPITIEDTGNKIFVVPPPSGGVVPQSSLREIGGSFSVKSKGYSFYFRHGYLAQFTIKGALPGLAGGHEEFRKRVVELSQKTSLIQKNQAYQLATNWLSLTGLNLEKLNSECTCSINQSEFNLPLSDEDLSPMKRFKTPIFTIAWTRPPKWRGSDKACTVVIDGSEMKLLGWEVSDTSFFASSPIQLYDKERTPEDDIVNLDDDEVMREVAEVRKNLDNANKDPENESQELEKKQLRVFLEQVVEDRKEQFKYLNQFKKLLAISDEEFQKMDATQKSNLVQRFVTPESFPPPKKKTNEKKTE